MLFAVGMIVANGEERIVAFAKKFYLPLLIVNVAATVGLYFATEHMLETRSYWSETETNLMYGDKFACLACQLPFVFFFVISLLLVTMKVQFKNKVLDFLGKISLELYLIHNLFIGIFTDQHVIVLNSPFVYTLAVVICSILAATLLHFINQKLIRLIKR